MTKQGNRARDDGAENHSAKLHFRSPVITTCLVVIALCIGGYALSYLKAVFAPLLIALFIFFLTNPIVRYFQARNYSPAYSYLLVILITSLTFLGLGRVFYGSVQEVSEKIPIYRDTIRTKIKDAIPNLNKTMMDVLKSLRLDSGEQEKDSESSETKKSEEQKSDVQPETVSEIAQQGESPPPKDDADSKADRLVESFQKVLDDFRGAKPSEVKESPKTEEQRLGEMFTTFFSEGAAQFVNGIIGTSLEFLEIAVLTVFYLFFILIEAHKLPQRIKRGFAYESTQTLKEMGISIQRSIEQYLRVKTSVSFGLGATTGFIGMIFGLDFWLLWAGFMFLANYVTYVGSMVALVPPIAIAFLQFNSPLVAIILTTLMIANRLFWIDYVELRLTGQQLNVSPVILLLSIGLFGALWGVIGMVLAVPVVTSVKIALSQFDSTAHLASLLSED